MSGSGQIEKSLLGVQGAPSAAAALSTERCAPQEKEVTEAQPSMP